VTRNRSGRSRPSPLHHPSRRIRSLFPCPFASVIGLRLSHFLFASEAPQRAMSAAAHARAECACKGDMRRCFGGGMFTQLDSERMGSAGFRELDGNRASGGPVGLGSTLGSRTADGQSPTATALLGQESTSWASPTASVEGSGRSRTGRDHHRWEPPSSKSKGKPVGTGAPIEQRREGWRSTMPSSTPLNTTGAFRSNSVAETREPTSRECDGSCAQFSADESQRLRMTVPAPQLSRATFSDQEP
jgi:hypothetical protein